MSGKDLFEGMSYVDERFVEEAENKRLPNRTVSPWIKITSMAACLCLILLTLYSIKPYQEQGESELSMGMAAGDEASPGEGAVPEMSLEGQQAPIAPAYGAIGEVPSVILRVDQMTETGFIGTVAELIDTDIFEIGMTLNVVIADGARLETPGSENDSAGSYVMVQFVEYNEETKTIVVNMVQPAESPEAAH